MLALCANNYFDCLLTRGKISSGKFSKVCLVMCHHQIHQNMCFTYTRHLITSRSECDICIWFAQHNLACCLSFVSFILFRILELRIYLLNSNIFYCQAIIQTTDQTQVINLRGLLLLYRSYSLIFWIVWAYIKNG